MSCNPIAYASAALVCIICTIMKIFVDYNDDNTTNGGVGESAIIRKQCGGAVSHRFSEAPPVYSGVFHEIVMKDTIICRTLTPLRMHTVAAHEICTGGLRRSMSLTSMHTDLTRWSFMESNTHLYF